MENTNKKSLIIFGYSEMLSLAFLVKSKIVKVKKFNILQNVNEDKFFKAISSFISHDIFFTNVYYSCGPGGFTIIRKIISYVKALNYSNLSKIKFIGLNHLFLIAYYLNHKHKIKNQEFIISILSHSNNNFIQLFQRKTKSDLFPKSISDIRNIDLDLIESYIKSFNFYADNIHLAYMGPKTKFSFLFKNIVLIEEANIIETITRISNIIENNNLSKTKYKTFFQENFKPLYGKLPSTN